MIFCERTSARAGWSDGVDNSDTPRVRRPHMHTNDQPHKSYAAGIYAMD